MNLLERYYTVQNRVVRAAQSVQRAVSSVQLVAVSKGQALSQVETLYQAGHTHFGENRFPAATERALQAQAFTGAENPLHWHFIGHVQSRKGKLLVNPTFHLFHALDRLELAQKISNNAQALGVVLPVLLECNVSGEASKEGFALAGWQETPSLLAEFAVQVQEILQLPGLQVRGLMTMAPFDMDTEQTRPVFRSLRRLRDALQQQFPETDWENLSMGMSNDFEVAIQEGATIVRVGSAIFQGD